ncbi:glutathione S-transferase family protein [Falsiroseomonas sp. E2-1-a20]|uniref:glutathione S-transferase family protein n=1 Tax=Falsiroseomonas sp. E2-1-a20 TaxID=3239300 RepID=UPI003F3B873F
MKFFDSFGMNPRTIRFYLIEKGMDLPRQEVDILAADNRKPEYLNLNPAGQTPALALDDGSILSETVAIMEYLEEKHPTPALIGRTPEERAKTRMWWRRAEINICHPMVQGFYYAEGLDLFKTRIRCLPEAAVGMKERARDGMRWLNALLTGEWLAGDRFTVADICLYCYIDQLCDAGQPMPTECKNLQAWFERVGARPAAEQSIWKERPMGMRG